jgi:hypothetical protein
MEARLHTATSFGRRILDDLRAQVGRLDTSEILLVTLRVARVLKKHIWGSCFDLCIDDLAEEFAGGSDV